MSSILKGANTWQLHTFIKMDLLFSHDISLANLASTSAMEFLIRGSQYMITLGIYFNNSMVCW